MHNENRSNLPPAERLELERNAYNAAFSELGLGWHWDEKTYSELQSIAQEEEERLRTYVETQHRYLLTAYDARFLVNAIREAKMRCYDSALGQHSDH
jgi:hypothetical protein